MNDQSTVSTPTTSTPQDRADENRGSRSSAALVPSRREGRPAPRALPHRADGARQSRPLDCTSSDGRKRAGQGHRVNAMSTHGWSAEAGLVTPISRPDHAPRYRQRYPGVITPKPAFRARGDKGHFRSLRLLPWWSLGRWANRNITTSLGARSPSHCRPRYPGRSRRSCQPSFALSGAGRCSGLNSTRRRPSNPSFFQCVNGQRRGLHQPCAAPMGEEATISGRRSPSAFWSGRGRVCLSSAPRPRLDPFSQSTKHKESSSWPGHIRIESRRPRVNVRCRVRRAVVVDCSRMRRSAAT